MIPDDVKREATRAWVEYGRAICEAFRWPPGAIEAAPLLNVFENADEAGVRRFTAYVRRQAAELRDAPFMDED